MKEKHTPNDYLQQRCSCVCVCESMYEFASFKHLNTVQTSDNNWTKYIVLSNRPQNAPRKSTDLPEHFWKERKKNKNALCNIQNTKTLLIVFFFVLSLSLCVYFFCGFGIDPHFFLHPFHLDGNLYSLASNHFSRAHTFSDRFFLRNRTAYV